MNKTDHITYWKLSAEKSWNASKHLFEKADYVESLFFAHLALEKLIKAHWVKDNVQDIPPRIHNIRRLAEDTILVLDTNQVGLMEKMNTFQMEGRYPDYRFTIYQMFDQKNSKEVLDETEILYQWLLKQLP
jgi:HEPN domain-containing protein